LDAVSGVAQPVFGEGDFVGLIAFVVRVVHSDYSLVRLRV
jgi:hypothetical protein